MPRRVGILGGMGPQATVLLMSRVIAAVPAADDRDHVPLIVDQNPQVPSRIARLIEGTGEDPAPVLVAMARRLEAAGVEALAMPCNTAHHFAPAITAAVAIPFLDMTALSVAHARRLAGPDGRIGVLASPALRRIGLFDGKLGQAGLTAVYPEDEEALLDAIRRIKASGVDAVARDIFRRASMQLLEAGVATQMIACTEFSLLADSAEEGAKAFDTLDVLVGAILDFSLAREA
ncbi:aspartate/glutamate racemase family protein [Ancylobacter pratisalsi]|uniref:Aspartate/glutamate racemase family protein n=1 Tax=Ancylobacter pratisalsi TaxID=1745854 RepID=A0A6P1YY11_9HYPH|nr:amino acid racemase [Ancylobacter pratisalsi]QIB36434.1 aspartate/glutamate racemase family protein [Ancylobacter pratisalsi]